MTNTRNIPKLTIHPHATARSCATPKRRRLLHPFARNARVATHTNDINPATLAASHMDAEPKEVV